MALFLKFLTCTHIDSWGQSRLGQSRLGQSRLGQSRLELVCWAESAHGECCVRCAKCSVKRRVLCASAAHTLLTPPNTPQPTSRPLAERARERATYACPCAKQPRRSTATCPRPSVRPCVRQRVLCSRGATSVGVCLPRVCRVSTARVSSVYRACV
jgi:hypothetical protein